VDNLDIDAIHFAIILYHIKVGQNGLFPTATYDKLQKPWAKPRRLAKTEIVNEYGFSHLIQTIKSSKPWVRIRPFHPFGVWRNQDKDPKGLNPAPDRPTTTISWQMWFLDGKNGWIDTWSANLTGAWASLASIGSWMMVVQLMPIATNVYSGNGHV